MSNSLNSGSNATAGGGGSGSGGGGGGSGSGAGSGTFIDKIDPFKNQGRGFRLDSLRFTFLDGPWVV